MARLIRTTGVAISFMLLAGLTQPAVGDVYYEENFTQPPNPPWNTNNPSRYYRDVNAPGFPD
jgi:hypothetical protein